MGLAACLTLAASYALYQLHHESRLRADVADTLRELRKQGFKTSLADFKITNDTATQVRMSVLTSSENQLVKEPFDFGIMPRLADDTAMILSKQDPTVAAGAEHSPKPRTLGDPDGGTLDAACAAVMAGPISFDYDPAYPESSSVNQPGLVERLSLTFWRRAMEELSSDNQSAAWTNILAATHLVNAWEMRPFGLCHFDRLQMADYAFAGTWQALQNGRWPEAKLAALQREWESMNFFASVPDTAAFECASIKHDCEVLCQQPAFSYSFDKLPDAWNSIKERIRWADYRSYGVFVDEKNLLIYYQQREQELRQAVQSPTWKEMSRLPGVIDVAPFQSDYAPLMERIQDGLRDQSWDNFMLPADAGAEARRRIVITALALERFRLRHGVYPNALAQLVPELASSVPVDFMDGQPLRYRPTNDGHFVLYSVGLDCIDDGGKLPPTGRPMYIGRGTNQTWRNFCAPTNVDIVWPRPGWKAAAPK